MMRTLQNNDGTLMITSQVTEALQGTLIQYDPHFAVAKGVIRPPLVFEGQIEEEAAIATGSFNRPFISERATFHIVNTLHDQKFYLNRQAIYFCFAEPEKLFAYDNQRLTAHNILNMLSQEAQQKIAAGLSPALFIEPKSFWRLFSQVHVPGIRAVAIGSELVYDGRLYGVAPEDRLHVALTLDSEQRESAFILLRHTAERLARRLNCTVNDLAGRYFYVHRDPALPTAESCQQMRCLGVAEWACGSRHEGVVFHPLDPIWKAMGGDFDGDYANVFVLPFAVEHRSILPVRSYRLPKSAPQLPVVERIYQECSSPVESYLGQAILGATRLVEGGTITDELRSLAASVAQGAIDAKKHPIDQKQLINDMQVLTRAFVVARKRRGLRPYITDFIKQVQRVKGFAEKARAWASLVRFVEHFIPQTVLEEVLKERVLLIEQLYKDIEFYRHQRGVELPKTLVTRAKELTSPELARLIQPLTKRYLQLTAQMALAPSAENRFDGEYNELRLQRTAIENQIRLLITTGYYGDQYYPLTSVQIAAVAYAPARLAALYVPVAIFKLLGEQITRTITVLIGHEWRDQEVYEIGFLRQYVIPTLRHEFNRLFPDDRRHATLTILRHGPQTTRVDLMVAHA